MQSPSDLVADVNIGSYRKTPEISISFRSKDPIVIATVEKVRSDMDIPNLTTFTKKQASSH